MANVEDSSICATCGRPLPAQQGRGRQRRYCDSTCRSAARRKRSRAADLTASARKASIDSVQEPLAAVAAARELARSVEAALRDTVEAARTAGHTWQEIGEVLGTTRQAAFQRFGRPIDPRTGAAMSESVRPEMIERGVMLVVNLIEGNYAEVRRDFDETVTKAVHTDAAVAAIWANLAGLVGDYERMGAPFAHQLGDYTAIDVPLEFEAGSLTARVSYDARGKVAGLRFLPVTSESWPSSSN